jgi:hypothetical protein
VQELRQLRRGRVSGGQQVEVLVQCAKARGVVSIDVFGAEVGLNLTSSLVFITAGVTAARPLNASAAWQRDDASLHCYVDHSLVSCIGNNRTGVARFTRPMKNTSAAVVLHAP